MYDELDWLSTWPLDPFIGVDSLIAAYAWSCDLHFGVHNTFIMSMDQIEIVVHVEINLVLSASGMCTSRGGEWGGTNWTIELVQRPDMHAALTFDTVLYVWMGSPWHAQFTPPKVCTCLVPAEKPSPHMYSIKELQTKSSPCQKCGEADSSQVC
jgi:hypothetical protein